MTMKRMLAPAIGALMLQGLAAPTAQANDDWTRYAESGLQYCDAVILGQFWGESVDEAKATIGRKIGWGNEQIVYDNLDSARARGDRCDFHDTGFSYDDANVLAGMWQVSIDEAKAALAEKVSTGYRELANEVVAEAYQAMN